MGTILILRQLRIAPGFTWRASLRFAHCQEGNTCCYFVSRRRPPPASSNLAPLFCLRFAFLFFKPANNPSHLFMSSELTNPTPDAGTATDFPITAQPLRKARFHQSGRAERLEAELCWSQARGWPVGIIRRAGAFPFVHRNGSPWRRCRGAWWAPWGGTRLLWSFSTAQVPKAAGLQGVGAPASTKHKNCWLLEKALMLLCTQSGLALRGPGEKKS